MLVQHCIDGFEPSSAADGRCKPSAVVIARAARAARAVAMAVAAHDGLARSINPVHTMSDGDTLFSLGTGRAGKSLGMMVLATMAAEATARATVRAVQAARSVTTAEGLYLPAMADLRG